MKKFLAVCIFSSLLINCNTSDEADGIDCAGMACTEIYVSLNVSVVNGDGEAVTLDSFMVIDKESSEDITEIVGSDTAQFGLGYPLYNDSFVSKNQNTKKTIIFKGFIDGNMVAEGEFEVIIDCCHVGLTKDKAEIIVN